MTGAAWIMLIATWSIILFFTIRYFLLVLRKPERKDDRG